MRKVNLQVLYIIILLVVGIIPPILSFEPGHILAHADMEIPQISISRSIERAFYDWNSEMGVGTARPFMRQALFPWYFAYWLLEQVGLPPAAAQLVIYTILFTLAGLAMFCMVRLIFPANQFIHAAFVAGLFYLFNLYHLQVTWRALLDFNHAYMTFPLLLGVYIRALQSGSPKYWRLFLLVSLLAFVGQPVLPLILMQLLTLALYTMYALAFSKSQRRMIRQILQYGLLSVLVHCVWILPTLYWIVGGEAAAFGATPVRRSAEVYGFASEFQTLPNVFRLLMFVWFFSDIFVGGILAPIHPFADSFETNPVLLVLGFLPALFAFMVLLISRVRALRSKDGELLLFFSLLAIVGLFLMKGIASPLSQVSEFLYRYVPGMTAFRSSGDKFGYIPTVAYAVLIGWCVNWGMSKYSLKLWKARIYIVSISLVICGFTFPFWQGLAFRLEGYIKIPDSHYELAAHLNADTNFYRTLFVPWFRHLTFTSYEWGYIGGWMPMGYLVDKPYINSSNKSSPANTEMNILFAQAIESGDTNLLSSLLHLYSVGKMVIEHDADPEPNLDIFPWEAIDHLASSPPLTFEQAFGQLDLYDVEREVLPPIYAADYIGTVAGEIGGATSIFELIGHQPGQALLFDNPPQQAALTAGVVDDIWVAPEPTLHHDEMAYQFEIVQPATYELWIEPTVETLALELGGQIFQMNRSKHKLVSLGNIYLEPGIHELKVVSPSTSSFVRLTSFEEGDDTSILFRGAGLDLIRSTDAIDGDRSLQLVCPSETSCIGPLLSLDGHPEFSPGDKYLLTLDYKYVQGAPPLVSIRQELPLDSFSTVDNVILLAQEFEESQEWRQYQTVFSPRYNAESLQLMIWVNSPIRAEDSVIQFYDNIRWAKLPINSIVLRANRPVRNLSPQVTYVKINPTRYKVHIEGAKEPFLLVFSEEFHRDWAAFVGGERVQESEHLVANGYANSWWIKESGSYDVVLEYRPQRMAYYGICVSLATLLSWGGYEAVKRFLVLKRGVRIHHG